MFPRAQLTAKPFHCFMATKASVYNLPMKQACAFEDNTEPQPAPGTTRRVRELPRTSLACRHNRTGRKRATQPFQLRREKDIASECSTIRCARDDDAPVFHRGPARSNGDGS